MTIRPLRLVYLAAGLGTLDSWPSCNIQSAHTFSDSRPDPSPQ